MSDPTLLDAARHIPLFSELALEDLMTLLHAGHSARYPKNTLLFQDGDDYRGFYVVLAGAVKVYKLLPDGNETLLHVQTTNQTLAEIPMFIGGGYPANAMTISEAFLLFIEKNAFLERMRTDPSLALKMLAGLSKRMKVMGAQLEKLSAMDVRTRLVRFLLDELDKRPEGTLVRAVILPVSKSLLAAQLGVALPTLSRTFRKLATDGLLRVRGRKVFIDDPDALQREIAAHR